MVIGLPQKTGV